MMYSQKSYYAEENVNWELVELFTKCWVGCSALHHNHLSTELEKLRTKEKRESKELQTKYDLLEEDFVVQKAQVSHTVQ